MVGRRGPTSIRWSLFFSFGGLTLLITGALLFINIGGSGRSLRLISRTIIQGTADRMDSEVRRFLAPVVNHLGLARAYAADGIINPAETERMNRQLIPLMRRYRQISSINTGDEAGNGYLLLRAEEDGQEVWRNRIVRAGWGHETRWMTWKNEHELIREETREMDYDPRKRPWYQGAEKEPGLIHWTEPYTFFTTKDPGITASLKMIDSEGRPFTLAFDVLLEDISGYTRSLQPTERGMAMLLTRKGELLGLPRHPKFDNPEARKKAALTLIDDIGIPELVEGARVQRERGTTNIDPFPYPVDGETWWAGLQVLPIMPEQPLIIVVSVPEADFLGEVRERRHIMFAITGGGIVLTVIIAILLAGRYSRPLKELVAQSERIGGLDLAPGPKVRSGLAEIAVLADAHERMREALETFLAQRKEAEDALEQSEEQLRQAQKMEAVGRLAGGVAHDFNNMLTAILGYGQMLQRKMAEDDPQRRKVNQIVRAGERAAGLTRQLLAFSRRQVLQPKIVDVNVIISELEKMLQRMIGSDVKLESKLCPDIGRIKADPGQIEQVLMNLAVNARDAMPEGGNLTIETSGAEFEGSEPVAKRCGIEGSWVRISVRDTGTGIDPEVLPKIFEPFFTTKGEGKGTGLGLSTVYGIVRQSGGEIIVDSRKGGGTTFDVYLPAVDAKAETLFHEAVSEEIQGGTETILVVEDEPVLRLLAAEVLKEKGYTILTAAGGEEAINQEAAHDGSIGLILTDLVMPGMSGTELAQRMLRRRKDLKILFMSGHTDRPLSATDLAKPGVGFIQKPFEGDALCREIRKVLDS